MIKNKFGYYKSAIRKANLMKSIESNPIIKHFCPKEDAYIRTKDNFKKLNISTSVEMMVFYKFIIVIFSFILMILLNQYYIGQKRNDIVHGINSSNTAMSFQGDVVNKQNDEEQIILSELVARHKNIRGLLRETNLNDLYNEIKTIQDELVIADPGNKIAKQVLENIITLNEIKIKPYNVLLIFLVSVLISNVINLYIKVKLKLLEAKIEAEINLIEMLTFTLVSNNNISVEQILKKQRNYSKILRGYYDKCLRVYPFDNEKAISDLKKDINNEEFNKFIFIIEKNLLTDRDVNNKLLKAHRNLKNELLEERKKKKDSSKSLLFTIISLPVVFMAYIILFAPILYYVSLMLK